MLKSVFRHLTSEISLYAFQTPLRIPAAGRPARRHRDARPGPGRGRERPGAARHHGLGQDLLGRHRHRAHAAPDARHRAQQDARRAALPGVQVVLPRELGRVLRLLLRLLPAGGVRPGLGHVHREGGDDQRGDRPPAPVRHPRALRAARRDRRRLGLLHLRPRRPGRLLRLILFVEPGMKTTREQLLQRLVELQYERSDVEFDRGSFRVRGDTVEVYPSYQDQAYRIELWGDEVDSVSTIDPLLGEVLEKHTSRLPIYPKTHYVMPKSTVKRAIKTIRDELEWWEPQLIKEGKLVEAQRLHQRTMYDLEMIKEMGFCRGIENYSRHLTGKPPGAPPPTLLDYLPENSLVVIDESHQTVPQIRGMFNGDQSRKRTLVEYGFRLPSAMDNRPLNFEEFEARVGQTVYVSATPGPYELTRTGGEVVEQIIRPTGLTDPRVEIRPVKGQIDDLLGECRARAERNERVLVTTLTKKMAEDLTEYFAEVGVRVRYLHSDIETLERIRILRDLRRGEFDVLVGINLLREGLDLPEVSLVAIL